MKKTVIKVIKQIVKDYGEQCKYFEIDCPACRAYLAIRLLENMYDVYVVTRKVGK
jgi:hypothetical protein